MEDFLKQPCEPEDDSGRLTECFINNLGKMPLSAEEAIVLMFDSKKEELFTNLQPIFNLIRDYAKEGFGHIRIPCYVRVPTDRLSDFNSFWVTNIEKGATNGLHLVEFKNSWLKNPLYTHALKTLGYEISSDIPIKLGEGERSIISYTIRWDHDNTKIS